ncbi:MAG: DUF1059 domain-containing protein [Candidatus Micrarchaeaceae archaeon]
MSKKTFSCQDIGISCGFKAEAENEQTLLPKIAAHAKKEHGMKNIDEATMKKIKSAIR